MDNLRLDGIVHTRAIQMFYFFFFSKLVRHLLESGQQVVYVQRLFLLIFAGVGLVVFTRLGVLWFAVVTA